MYFTPLPPLTEKMSKKKIVKHVAPSTNSSLSSEKNQFFFTSSYAIAGLLVLCAIFFWQVIFGAGNFWEDAVQLEFPNRVFARNSLLHFEFPHWNPYSFNGMPFFATQLPGVLYPLNFLISFLPLSLGPFWYLLQLLMVLHSAISGITMFFFLKNKKFSIGAGFFGAVSYMFCGFIVTHAVHPMMINIVVWLPLILMLLEKAMLTEKFHFALMGGLVLGATTLAGHPQLTFYEFLFVAVYSLAVFLGEKDKKYIRLAMPVIVAIIGIAVSMVQTLPSVEINSQAARADWSFESASEGSISWRQLITAVLPKLFGAWTGEQGNAVPAFWLNDSFHSGYYTYWETCFYSGIALLILSISFLIVQRKNKFFLVLILWLLFSLAVAMGSHFFLYNILFHTIPGFNRFRSPARILFTWNFILPLLGAAAFDGLKNFDVKNIFFKLVIAGSCVCLILGLAAGCGFFQNIWPEMSLENRGGYAAVQGWMACVNALFPLILFLLYRRSKLSVSWLRRLVVIAVIFDLFTFGMGHHIIKEAVAQRYFGGNQEIISELKEQTRDGRSRVSIRQFSLEPGQQIGRQTSLMLLNKCQSMIDNIQFVEGYSPLNLLRKFPPASFSQLGMFLDLLNVSFYINPDYKGNSREFILANPNFLPRARMFYRAKIFPNDSLIAQAMLAGQLDYHNELALTEKPEIPLPDSGKDPTNEVRITSYKANKIALDVETQAPGLLWMSEIWFSAWKAKIDGKKTKILCADNSFRTIAVPAGVHKVEFFYSSSYFNAGALIASLTIFLSLALLIIYHLKRKSTA
jgi:hypothetical protein